MTYKIDSALIQAFVDGGFSLAYTTENVAYEPTAGTPWAELYIIQNQPSVGSLGPGGYDDTDGFMQINLNYPQGVGAGAAKQKATDIRDYFLAGTRFTYSGQELVIFSCGRGPARNVDSWYQIPITVFWRSWVSR